MCVLPRQELLLTQCLACSYEQYWSFVLEGVEPALNNAVNRIVFKAMSVSLFGMVPFSVCWTERKFYLKPNTDFANLVIVMLLYN